MCHGRPSTSMGVLSRLKYNKVWQCEDAHLLNQLPATLGNQRNEEVHPRINHPAERH